jgi:hypothetical protein
MPQVLKQDKVGNLSHNAGVITLASGILTIGGQQYVVSNISRTIATDVTMAANTRYQVFAVVVSGSVQLRISANENSSGPAGFSSWKLVGSFFSGNNSLFRLFVSIEDRIMADVRARYFRSTALNSTTTPTVINFDTASYDEYATVTVGAGWNFRAVIPGYYRIISQYPRTTGGNENHNLAIRRNGSTTIAQGQLAYNNGGETIHAITVVYLNAGDTIDLLTSNGTGTVTITVGTDRTFVTIDYEGNGINNTPIKDL